MVVSRSQAPKDGESSGSRPGPVMFHTQPSLFPALCSSWANGTASESMPASIGSEHLPVPARSPSGLPLGWDVCLDLALPACLLRFCPASAGFGRDFLGDVSARALSNMVVGMPKSRGSIFITRFLRDIMAEKGTISRRREKRGTGTICALSPRSQRYLIISCVNP